MRRTMSRSAGCSSSSSAGESATCVRSLPRSSSFGSTPWSSARKVSVQSSELNSEMASDSLSGSLYDLAVEPAMRISIRLRRSGESTDCSSLSFFFLTAFWIISRALNS